MKSTNGKPVQKQLPLWFRIIAVLFRFVLLLLGILFLVRKTVYKEVLPKLYLICGFTGGSAKALFKA